MQNVSGTDQHCFRGKGAHSRRNGSNADKTIVFHNVLKVSQGLLASIVCNFADDTTIYACDTSIEAVIIRLESEQTMP